MSVDETIYLDVGFVSQKYEEATGVAPDVQVSRAEGLQAGVRIPLFSGGAFSRESKSYKISISQMQKEIEQRLRAYPQFLPEAWQRGQNTFTCWVTGNLTVAEARVTRRTHTICFGDAPVNARAHEDEVSLHTYFEITVDDKLRLVLITKPEYLSSGFDDLLEISSGLRRYISIPVRGLVRVMYHVEDMNTFVCAPLVVEENKANKAMESTR